MATANKETRAMSENCIVICCLVEFISVFENWNSDDDSEEWKHAIGERGRVYILEFPCVPSEQQDFARR